MTDALTLTEYNTWANRRLAEKIGMLPNDLVTKEVGGSFPSIRLTLLHVLTSDWIWMHRWKGIPLADIPDEWPAEDTPSLIKIWTTVQDEMIALAKELTADPNKMIAFITRKGDAFSMPFLNIVIHVTNHGSYHRGQIVNMLRMLGEQPVDTDYFIFYTQNNK